MPWRLISSVGSRRSARGRDLGGFAGACPVQAQPDQAEASGFQERSDRRWWQNAIICYGLLGSPG